MVGFLVAPASQPRPLVSSLTPKWYHRVKQYTPPTHTHSEFSLPHGPQLVRKKYNSFVQQSRKTHRCQSKHALLTLALKLLLPYSLDFPGRRDTNFYTNQTQGKYFQVLQVVLLKSHHLSWVEKNLALEQFSSKNSLNKIHPLLFRSGWGGLNWDKIAWALNVILAVSNACAIRSWVNYVFLYACFIICKMWVRVGLS